MRITTILCDTCGQEIKGQEGSVFTGILHKVNTKMEVERINFEGHYCAKETEIILGEITKLKNAENPSSVPVSK